MGSQAKKQNDLLDSNRTLFNNQYNTQNKTSSDRSNTAYSQQQGARPGLDSAFQGYASTGGFDPGEYDSALNDIAGTSGWGGGGYSSGGGSTVADELTRTGGIDASKFDSALKGYSDFASGGGGLDTNAMRQRANSVIPSFYKNLQNEAARRKMVNPYAPSYDASAASMSRDAAQQTQNNVRDTDLDISAQVAANRKFGIEGLGSLNTNIQGMTQAGKIAGGGQQISNAGLGLQAAGLNEQAAARKQSGRLQLMGMKQSGKQYGTSGQAGLYSDDASQARGYGQDIYGGIGGNATSNLAYINARKDPSSWWKSLLKSGLGALGSLGGGAGIKANDPKVDPEGNDLYALPWSTTT